MPDDITEITIHSFHPFNVDLPETEQISGKVRIVLPEVHVQVWDLSMGILLLEGAHLGADVPWLGVDIDLPEPMDTGKLMLFLIASKDEFEKIWQLGQTQLDAHGALL